MANYTESGVLNLVEGDCLCVFTDGFEDYINNPVFLDLFKDHGADIKELIKEFSKRMNLKDPEKYGHERSLIVIFI